jgi:hypothetical protein
MKTKTMIATAFLLTATLAIGFAPAADAHVCNGAACGCLISVSPPGHVHTDLSCITSSIGAEKADNGFVAWHVTAQVLGILLVLGPFAFA